MVVQVGDGHLRIPAAYRGDQLGGRQRAAAQGEEVGLGTVHGGGQHVAPQPGQPAHGAAEVGFVLGSGAGRRPGQRIAVHLARGAGGQFVEQNQPRYQRGGQCLGQGGAGGRQVERGIGAGNVADQQRRAAGGLAHRGRAAADPGQVDQGGVDLTELDPAPTDLHLVVGAALEVQTVEFQADQIAAAVGALPTQRRHLGVLLGILGRVEVAGQSDTADDQFTDFADVHGSALFVDHGQVPARQRQPDADRRPPVQRGGAGHHRRLGGAVGVPHLAAVHGEPFGQFGWAGLAAEDQQPDRLQRLGGPQRGQRRYRRDDRDVTADQPRTQIHAAAHQRPRRRYQARTVAPGQPHLLAGCVEGDRQPGQHPVTGADGSRLQEHAGLGVDERGGVPVGDGHALRGSGGARGEDDPGVIAGQRWGRAPAARRTRSTDQTGLGDDRDDLGLTEHQRRPFLGVVGVDGDVRGAGGQGGQDRGVQRIAARRHPNADPVAAADPAGGQPGDTLLDVTDQLGVGELHLAVVDGRRVRVATRGLVEDVDQGPRGGSRW